MDYPKCQNPNCNNLVKEKYQAKWKGWRKACSIQCENALKQINSKKTKLEKYGTEYPLLLSSVREKIKQTNLERYGVENPAQREDIKKKIKNTIIEKYGCSHQMQNQDVKEKVKQTNIKIYGTENPSSSTVVKEKRKNTFKEKYGVENPFQLESTKDKIKKTVYEKYGVFCPQHIEIGEYASSKLNDVNWLKENIEKKSIVEITNELNVSRQTIVKYLKIHGLVDLSKSYFEEDIKTFLNSLNINFVERNRKLIYPLELDFYIPDKNIAIECNGIYWHTEISGNKDKNYHNHKSLECIKHGVKLIHLWEHEWNQNNELAKSRLRSKLGLNERLYARNTVIRSISNDNAREFLDQNHIQGHCTSSIRYGLYLEDELVALMTFGKSRFNKKIDYELLRYCSKIGHNVIGGANKLFKHFVKNHHPKSVISYSDRSWNIGGNLYATLEFIHSHTSSPAYFYTKNYSSFESRIKYQKHKLSKILDQYDPDLTEWENMKMNGYDRIWDCGTDVYVWMEPTGS